MREQQNPVEPVSIDTPLGRINVRPLGTGGVRVDAPHLTVGTIALRAWAFLSGDKASGYQPQPTMYNDGQGGHRFSVPPEILGGAMVDGRAPIPSGSAKSPK
jgi:hypothetical protein